MIQCCVARLLEIVEWELMQLARQVAGSEEGFDEVLGPVGGARIADDPAVDVVGEPTALGDKDLLASATANLVDNALKYGGSAATTVRVGAREDGEAVSIVVQDEGPGIALEERAKVITRFYRVDRSRSLPGNGLGLAIVTAISHLHSGSLSLEDAAPGLIARIVLPRASLNSQARYLDEVTAQLMGSNVTAEPLRKGKRRDRRVREAAL